jgi:hypothetical protein
MLAIREMTKEEAAKPHCLRCGMTRKDIRREGKGSPCWRAPKHVYK